MTRAWRLWLPVGLALGLALGGCVSETAGHEQQLALELEGALPKTVATATVVVAAAELHTCSWARSAERPSPLAQLSEWWLPKAHAHSESSALRIGVPRVVELHGGDGARTSLGRFFAPEGQYCHVVLELAPADDDAVGADGGALDTLHVTFHGERDALHSSGRRTLTVPLESPLVVQGAPAQQAMTLAVSLERWPIADMLDAEQALSVLTRAIVAR